MVDITILNGDYNGLFIAHQAVHMQRSIHGFPLSGAVVITTQSKNLALAGRSPLWPVAYTAVSAEVYHGALPRPKMLEVHGSSGSGYGTHQILQ